MIDDDDRYWSHREQLDAPDTTCGEGGDRYWPCMRGEGVNGDFPPVRDLPYMLHGPVDATAVHRYGGGCGGGEDRDWGSRKDPIEAGGTPGREYDDAWGSARRQTVDASFPSTSADRDLSVRKPFEASSRDNRETN